jgi:uncharacterized protein with GYD domain
MVVGSYAAESWAGMMRSPEDRSTVARQACEALGGSLDAFYWAFGPDDWLAIADLPDEITAVAVSSSGAVRDVRTVRLLTMDEGHAMLQKAKAVAAAYRRPGSS